MATMVLASTIVPIDHHLIASSTDTIRTSERRSRADFLTGSQG